MEVGALAATGLTGHGWSAGRGVLGSSSRQHESCQIWGLCLALGATEEGCRVSVRRKTGEGALSLPQVCCGLCQLEGW